MKQNKNTRSYERSALFEVPYLTEGILIAAVPVIAYMCAFVWECGVMEYFDAPIDFIVVDLAPVIYVGTIELLILSILLTLNPILIDIYLAVFRKKWLQIVLVLFCGGFFLMTYIGIKKIVSVATLPLTFVALFLLISAHNRKRYLSRHRFDSYYYKFAKPIASLVALIIIFSVSSYSLGYIMAYFRTDHSITSINNQEYVLIRKYGDLVILKKINRDAGFFEKEVRIVKAKDESDLEFIHEKLPLNSR